jgi:anti-sigma-K factor RskA
MKTTKLNTLTKTLFLGVLATMIIFSFYSCAKKAFFLTSSVVPAAQGEVTVTKDKNNNYVIKMQISNLAQVDRLQPPKKSYVVWMEAERGITRNIGLITSSTKLKVSFETVATLRPTRIFITAEEDEGVQYPGSMVVLTTGRL